ncbi:MAG: mandelate racemase [Myxococcales bacterium]|nr:mandelate racemase [Myxococcales bacterium]
MSIDAVQTRSFTIPTERPESDGTLSWTSTTVVVVEVTSGDLTGVGYTYCSSAAAALIERVLRDVVAGGDPMAIERHWWRMLEAVRNFGREGIGACAISAVDLALWDLKAKRLGLPLCDLLGAVRDAAPIYASGGFTSLEGKELEEHLHTLLETGAERAKIKIGREPERDPERLALARRVLGRDRVLMVDANGAYSIPEALRIAETLESYEVDWFEEPVSSDNLVGLRRVRDTTSGSLRVTAGEYGWDPYYFRRVLEFDAVDVLQLDVTRCLGISGALRVIHACESHHKPLSFHCAPAMHAHLACCARPLIHCEYFFDHARIEQILFDQVGVTNGVLEPDRCRPGHGVKLRANTVGQGKAEGADIVTLQAQAPLESTRGESTPEGSYL